MKHDDCCQVAAKIITYLPWDGYDYLKYDDCCLVTDANQLRSTGYMEFIPGKHSGKYWSDKSVFIYEGHMDVIHDLFEKANKEYDHYDDTYFDNDQINILIDGLSQRLNEMCDEKYKLITEVLYREDDTLRVFEEPKEKIIKMVEDLIVWLNANRAGGISVLGI